MEDNWKGERGQKKGLIFNILDWDSGSPGFTLPWATSHSLLAPALNPHMKNLDKHFIYLIEFCVHKSMPVWEPYDGEKG